LSSKEQQRLNVKGRRINLLTEFQSILPDFGCFYTPTYSGYAAKIKVNFDVSKGVAIFVKKPLSLEAKGEMYIFGNAKTKINENFTNTPKRMNYALIKARQGENFWVFNAHGQWHPGNKLDTSARFKQSRKIKSLLDSTAGSKIFCGDFNLMPDTQSIKILQVGMRDSIKEYNIQNTRNKISWDEHGNNQRFADYVFVSPEVQVQNFEVPYNEVSDHLPLILDFYL
jgi:hypothetical protein